MIPDWARVLNGDPFPWLLAEENPSVRYWTLKDLFEQPAETPELLAARAAVDEQPLVKEIFARQHPEGHWGEDPGKPYTAEGAVTMLSLLYQLGASPNAATNAGCDSMLEHFQHACGGFSLAKKTRSGIFPCTTGENLPMLLYFGLGADPRVQAAYEFVLTEMDRPDALVCGRYQHQPCLWGAIATLNGLAALPAEQRSARCAALIETLANVLLDAAYDFEGEHKRWLSFGVPRAWDLLSALKVLAALGYAHDERFGRLFSLVLQRQDAQGRWICGSTSRVWPLEKRGQPSRWVTLDVLRVLKRYNSSN